MSSLVKRIEQLEKTVRVVDGPNVIFLCGAERLSDGTIESKPEVALIVNGASISRSPHESCDDFERRANNHFDPEQHP
ncbi:MAG: hypothetical protein AAFZ99_06575 [Pseudomonadota bacterium]